MKNVRMALIVLINNVLRMVGRGGRGPHCFLHCSCRPSSLQARGRPVYKHSCCLVPLTAIPSDIVMALLGRTVTKSINENTRARLIMAWLSGLLLMAIAANLHLQII